MMEFELVEELPLDERGSRGESAIIHARPVRNSSAIADPYLPAKDQAICIPEQEDG